MKNKSTEGILFSTDAVIPKKQSIEVRLPKLIVTPRKSWNYAEKDIFKAFEPVSGANPKNIFVFSYLRNGKIGFEDDFCIYTDSDCEILDSFLKKSDDVCSEEFSAEILIPVLNTYYPDAKINQFLAPEKNGCNLVFMKKLWNEYPESLFIVSKNDSEDSVWPDNLQD